jgi:hypothetical protein
MKYYRCYLLDADFHIVGVKIIKCSDDKDARRRCQDILVSTLGFHCAEVWDGARRVYVYPGDEFGPADQDAQSGHERRKQQFRDVKTARLREQRLEGEAASRISPHNKFKV